MKRQSEKRNCRTVWLLPTLLLTGCAGICPPSTPVETPQTPALPPSLAKPVPLENFLDRAQRDIEEWRSRLRDSLTK